MIIINILIVSYSKNEDTEIILDDEEKKSFLNIIDESVYKIYYSHNSDITDISWSKKYQNILVTVSIDSKAVLYDINQNSPIDIFTHENALSSVCFYPGKILFLNKYIIDKNYISRLSNLLDESTKKEIMDIPEPTKDDDFFFAKKKTYQSYL